jgi:MFS superfamily sulfate permease-like transporter
MNRWRGLAAGLAAGAAGTTVLNAVTYLDMAARGRPASSTPEDTVEKLAAKVGVVIRGDEGTRKNRLTGLGALLGLVAGSAVGGALGLARAFGFRPKPLVAGVLTGVGAMAGTNAPMAALGVTDLRTWSATDWLSDAVPHLAYGLVTAAVVQGLDRD